MPPAHQPTPGAGEVVRSARATPTDPRPRQGRPDSLAISPEQRYTRSYVTFSRQQFWSRHSPVMVWSVSPGPVPTKPLPPQTCWHALRVPRAPAGLARRNAEGGCAAPVQALCLSASGLYAQKSVPPLPRWLQLPRRAVAAIVRRRDDRVLEANRTSQKIPGSSARRHLAYCQAAGHAHAGNSRCHARLLGLFRALRRGRDLRLRHGWRKVPK